MVQGASIFEIVFTDVTHRYNPALNLSAIRMSNSAPPDFTVFAYWWGDVNPWTIDKWDGAGLDLYRSDLDKWWVTSTSRVQTDANISVTSWASTPPDRTKGTFTGKVESEFGPPWGYYTFLDAEFIAVRQ